MWISKSGMRKLLFYSRIQPWINAGEGLNDVCAPSLAHNASIVSGKEESWGLAGLPIRAAFMLNDATPGILALVLWPALWDIFVWVGFVLFQKQAASMYEVGLFV